jgi:uncharacterized protein YqeY
MGLQDTIKKDLVAAMKAKDVGKKETLRVVLGEFARMAQKQLSDDQVIRILRNLIKAEQEVLAGQSEQDSTFIQVIKSYLPQLASDEEIVAWIGANIDFSQFNSKMQAMRPIMQHFGSKADGSRVKALLQNM